MKEITRFITRMVALLFFISLFSIAAAADTPADEKEKAASSSEKTTDRAADASSAETVNISYIAFSNAMKIARTPEGKSAEPSPAAPAPQGSTAPMTVEEKFNYFARNAFRPPGNLIAPVVNGMIREALDNNEGKKDTFGDFLADSMTRAARGFAFRVASNFFEKFALASLFRQDPRYHNSYKEKTGARIGYAVSRVFVTRGDRGGSQFNASFLLGGAMAAALSNLWVRDEHRTVSDSFRRWGTHVGFTAVGHILREFLSGQ